MEFNPDQFLAEPTPEEGAEFNPDKFVDGGDFNPDQFLAEPEKTGVVEAGLAGLGAGSTLGFGDELSGAIGAAIDPLLYGDEGKDFSQRYQENRDFARRQNETAQKDQPGAYLVGQVGGGVASSLATGGGSAALGAKELVKRGAAEGAAAGLGTSNADLTKGEYVDAALDTTKGAVIGGIIPSVGVGGSKVLKAITPKATSIKDAIAKRANQIGDILNGFQDTAQNLAKGGTAKVLGVAENEIVEGLPQFLKAQGLNLGPKGVFKSGQNALEKNIDDIISGAKQGDIELATKAKEVLAKAKGGFAKGVDDMDAADIVAFTMAGPIGVAKKKIAQATYNRINALAPELLETAAQLPGKAANTITKAASKAGDIVELTAEGLTRPSITKNIAQSMVDVPKEHRDDSPFEKVEAQQVHLAKEANKKIVNDALKLGLAKRQADQLGSRVEGLFYGSGQIANENTLGNPEVLAETIITAKGPSLFDGKLEKPFNPAKKILGKEDTISAIPALDKAKEITLDDKPAELHNLVKGLNKVNTLSAIERANNDILNKINSSVDTFMRQPVDSKSASQLFSTNRTPQQRLADFSGYSDRLVELNSDPVMMQQYVDSKLGTLSQYAPESAAGMGIKMANAVNFLNEKLPKNPNDTSLNILNKKWQPTDMQVSKFNKYRKAVEQPLSVFDEMSKGVLSRESIEAVKTVYPEIYSKLQQTVIEKAASVKEDMPYQKKVQLSILLDRPLDVSMLPKSIAGLQTTFANSEEQQSDLRPNGAANINTESLMTDSQKLST